MKKSILVALVALALVAIASPVFAQEAAATNDVPWGKIGAAIALAFAAFGGALGQARATSAALSGMARNPGAAGNIRTTLIIGLALIESLVIYVLITFFLIPA